MARAPARDALSSVLHDLRLIDVSYGRCELTGPWGIEFGEVDAARFHFVAEGRCWLHAPGDERIELHTGDVVLLPRGSRHALADASDGPTRPLEAFAVEERDSRTYRMRAGGDGARTLLFCGSVSFEEPAIHPLLELMPQVLLLRGADAKDPALRTLLDTMAEEVLRERAGAATVLTRLADVVVARVVRAWAEGEKESAGGWLAGIRDPKIARALAAIHRQPGKAWSVESLADVAHISRSSFSARFTAVMGLPPAQYVARWRMHLASAWLRKERLTVAQVAERLGYESEPSFSRAFKRLRGIPPSQLRRPAL